MISKNHTTHGSNLNIQSQSPRNNEKHRKRNSEGRTRQMIFRKIGRAAKDDIIYNNTSPQLENSFKYLGITLQTTKSSHRPHVQERMTAATTPIHDIRVIQSLSTETAMILVNNKMPNSNIRT